MDDMGSDGGTHHSVAIVATLPPPIEICTVVFFWLGFQIMAEIVPRNPTTSYNFLKIYWRGMIFGS